MPCYQSVVLVVFVLPIFYSPRVSAESISVDNLLIDCGSSSNTSIGKRLFQADLRTAQSIFVSTNSSSALSGSLDSQLYKTARVFNETSSYTFPISIQGRHWIRLYIFPFADRIYSLSEAKFSVAAQNVTLLEEFRIENGYMVKEYSMNISSNYLVITFTPSANSFAFINALEIVPLPIDLIPASVKLAGSVDTQRNLGTLETVFRVNMGNESVSPENDTLSRSWVPDGSFLFSPKTQFVSKIDEVKFEDDLSENVAPKTVYGTATELDIGRDVLHVNLSWKFSVSPKFEYLFRFHFCNLGGESSQKPVFGLYVNSELVSSFGDQPGQSSSSVGVPYFSDAVVKVSQGDQVTVTLGPRTFDDSHSTTFLNGLEIMKLSDSKDSSEELATIPGRNSKRKIIVMASLAAGLFICAVSIVALLLRCRKRRRKLAIVGHSKVDGVAMNNTITVGTFSGAEIAYRFPLLAIREATDNFSENLVIGVGGFGKVYKGVLVDNRVVAIKRGIAQSTQGLAEFRTEIEMLSQFRHRHLVSLIGYCDEQGEMIIIYEYMENRTLKEHLYGSDFQSLSWRLRLQICIGSARGLHYLHTGTAKPIIHRDVKSANILLDENFMAKVADFGLSKAGPEIDKTHVSTAVKGSFGYLDPEYLIMQQLTEKSDVYSFGVVMLEVLCGRGVIDPSQSREKVNLIDWAMKCQKSGKLEEIVDSCLASQVKPEALVKFWEIAEKCLADRSVFRPSMGDVLWNLEYVLQLQGTEKTANGETSTQVSHISVGQSETMEFSTVNLGDLAGVSMSKVFAQMVLEESQ